MALPDMRDVVIVAGARTPFGTSRASTGSAAREQDHFAHRSHVAARAAQRAGRLAEEMVPVPVKSRGRVTEVAQDEHVKDDTSVEKLNARPPALGAEGTVTAGNTSAINDGAAAVVVTSRQRAERLGVAPLGRVVSWGVAGVKPGVTGIGPVPASRQALARSGLEVVQMDVVEINEAFAAQYLAVEHELGLVRDKTNVNGGAIALGHPPGASGARLALTPLHELRRRGGHFGLASLCIGGGQGIAMIVEALRA